MNTLKARIAPICGIIAFMAVIGIFMTGCGKEEKTTVPPPPGSVSIAADFGKYVGYPLVAVYTPDPGEPSTANISFYWFDKVVNGKLDYESNDFDFDTDKLNTTSTRFYKPTTVGTYVVIAIDQDLLDEVLDGEGDADIQWKESTPVTVLAVPSPLPEYSYFYGLWKMTGTSQTPSLGYDEDVKIGPELFYLIDKADGHFFNFVPSSWTSTTTPPADNPAIMPGTFNKGWELTGTTTAQYGSYPAVSTLQLWTETATQAVFYRTVWSTTDQKFWTVARKYDKVKAVTDITKQDLGITD